MEASYCELVEPRPPAVFCGTGDSPVGRGRSDALGRRPNSPSAARDRGTVWARRFVRAARSASSRPPAAELLPLVLLLLMLALTLALWSEVRIAQGTSGRSATWVLWGGLIASVVVSAAAWAAV